MFFAPSDAYQANLVAYYKLDVNSNDFSGNAHNGIDTAISYVSLGKVGNSAIFNGTTSFISVPQSVDFDFSTSVSDIPFSISFWLYVSNTNLRYVIARGISINNLQFDCSINPNFSFWLYSGTAPNYIGKIIQEAQSLNVWQHFAVTYDGSSTIEGLKLYKNGILKATDNFNNGYIKMNQNTDSLIIGKRSYGTTTSFYNGRQDELYIWKNRILTPNEILDAFNLGNAGFSLI